MPGPGTSVPLRGRLTNEPDSATGFAAPSMNDSVAVEPASDCSTVTEMGVVCPRLQLEAPGVPGHTPGCATTAVPVDAAGRHAARTCTGLTVTANVEWFAAP